MWDRVRALKIPSILDVLPTAKFPMFVDLTPSEWLVELTAKTKPEPLRTLWSISVTPGAPGAYESTSWSAPRSFARCGLCKSRGGPVSVHHHITRFQQAAWDRVGAPGSLLSLEVSLNEL